MTCSTDNPAVEQWVPLVSSEKDIVLEVVPRDGPGAAVKLAEELCPDVVLLDISMPVLNGFRPYARIIERLPEARIVIVSSHSDATYVEEAFRIGAHGYVLKGSAMLQVPKAIEAAFSGGVFRPV